MPEARAASLPRHPEGSEEKSGRSLLSGQFGGGGGGWLELRTRGDPATGI